MYCYGKLMRIFTVEDPSHPFSNQPKQDVIGFAIQLTLCKLVCLHHMVVNPDQSLVYFMFRV